MTTALISVFCVLQSMGSIKSQRVEYQLTQGEATSIAHTLGLKGYQAPGFSAKACENVQMLFDETAADPARD